MESHFKKAGNIIHKVMLNIAGLSYREYMLIYLNWEKVVGKIMAERLFPEKYINGNLYVSAKHSISLLELRLWKKKYINDIKKLTNISIQEIIYYYKDRK